MKIGIDISQIAFKGSGIERFTSGLIKTILKYDKNNEWIFFFSSLRNQLDYDIKTQIQNKGFQIKDYPFPPTLLTLMWNKLHLFKIDNLIKNLDWLITSDWTEPPSSFKKATIVHDLVYKRFPETLSSIISKNQNLKLKHVRKESKVIFADSLSTKNDLISLLEIPENKIIVNYPGVHIIETNEDFDLNILKKNNINNRFILSVGKIEPRKNIQMLIDAYIELDLSSIDLVIVGDYGWGPHIKKYDNIKYLGYLDDKELFSLYKKSLCFIYPSIWEGFGYPIIEAMASKTPVATSNTSSMKEISNNAALLFNPYKKIEIKNSINKLINHPDLRKDLIRKGIINAQKFTWKNYYINLISTLESII